MIRSLLLASAACALALPATAQTVAIVNARIEPVSSAAIPAGTLVIKDGKIAALGAKAAYVGKVQDDQLGAVFRHDIRATGVDFRTPPLRQGPPTARCLVFVTKDAQRTMATYLGACVEQRLYHFLFASPDSRLQCVAIPPALRVDIYSALRQHGNYQLLVAIERQHVQWSDVFTAL